MLLRENRIRMSIELLKMEIKELFDSCIEFMTNHLNTVDVPVFHKAKEYIELSIV